MSEAETNFLSKSLDENKQAKKDARQYHKLTTDEPETLQFVIDDVNKDVTVERKVDENGKPYSETTFLRVIDLKSTVQEPKPLRTSSRRLLEKLDEQFSQGNFTLEIRKFGSNFDTDYKVKSVK